MSTADPLRLEGRVAMVTGASRGIGRAVATTLARHGARLVLAARSVEHLDAVAAEVSGLGEAPTLLGYDVADAGAIKDAFRQVAKLGLDVMVNNAGILDDALLGMITADQLNQTLAVNTAAVVHHLQLAARLMGRRGGGSIVNMSSIVGRVGNAGQVAYGASKAAVIGATLSAAKELAPRGIRVNAVAPGLIDTDMVRALPADKFEARRAAIGMQRVGTPADVADAVLFLASDLSAYVTGQVLGVDGGMLL